MSPSGKALGSGPSIRGFESLHPSHENGRVFTRPFSCFSGVERYNKDMINFQLLYRKIKAFLTGKSDPFASTPYEFKVEDWKLALLATKDSVSGKRIGILAAGIAYFATLAFFPFMAAAVAIAGFVISPDQLHSIVTSIEGFLPADIASLVTSQLQTAVYNKSANVLIAIFGILLAIFSVSGAVANMISASNVSYEVEETRKFVKLRLTSLAILGSGVVAGILVVALLLLTGPILGPLGVPGYLITILSIARWFAIAAVVAVMLAVFYKYGPNRPNQKWQWVSWGSIIASVLWLIGTALFFIYARYFAHFSQTYSLFAGIIVLMTWFNLTSFIILLGAEINYRLENQTLLKPKIKKKTSRSRKRK